MSELFARGSVGKSRLVLVRALANGLAYTRVALIAPKAAGKAVARNRLRRRLRAAYRQRKAELPVGFDCAVLGRRGANEAAFALLLEDLCKAIRRATEAEASRRPPCAGTEIEPCAGF